MVAFPDIPQALIPADGRFGCGPSKVRTAQIEALSAPLLMGTSHRAAPVRDVVASLKDGLRTLLSVPSDYEVVLGNGGASAFWDVACACLISARATFGSWGAFGAKFASEAAHWALSTAWGTETVNIGQGGSIPFIATLKETFPEAQVLVTGIEDPDTRAHSENESMHLGELEHIVVAEVLLLARLGGAIAS